MGYENADLGCVGVHSGRDDLAKVSDMLREILGVGVTLGLSPRQVPHFQTSIESGANKKRAIDIETKSKPFIVRKCQGLFDCSLKCSYVDFKIF